ncbi:GrpB family protein [Flexivirga alba]|uniref:GrpB family protein n=1 Tax=Flexivirga alba TaxID=702742 RepID=A0ABW2ADM6_9MICO
MWRPFNPGANAQRQGERVAFRQSEIGPLTATDHEKFVPQYDALREDLHSALGVIALTIAHVGSTAVPGLLAKPVIDIDLTVPDVDAERTYLPALESIGWRLIFRDDFGGDAHRQLTYADPNANLHVWSPGAIEPQRHLLFKRWLIGHPAARERYAAAKRSALSGVTTYNDAKAGVVYDLYEEAFAADLDHPHDPRPRPSSPE